MNEPTLSQEPAPRLGRLTPRDTKGAASRSAAYSRFVGLMRMLLPIFVCIILVVLFLWPHLNVQRLSEKAVENIPNLMVERLNLTGIDAKNHAYSLTADRALQAGGLKNVVELEKPEGDIALSDGAWLMGRAAKGRIEQETKNLWLGGDVEIFHNQGYRFLTDEMFVDMGKSEAWGEKVVLFQGSFGEIRGQGFRLEQAGDTIMIKGPAQARLGLHAVKPSDKPSVNHSTSR